VHTKGDVAHLSADRKQWVSAAMRSAAFLVSSVANKRLEKDSEFGNHNFHVGIVATARYLIRMAELLPDVGDLHQISLDIDRLLLKLPHCKCRLSPGVQSGATTDKQILRDPLSTVSDER